MPVLQKKALFSAFIICQVLRIIQNYMEVSPAKSLILSATIHGGSYFFIQPAIYELPYDGAKEMLLVDNVDNKDFLTRLFVAMYDELPAQKKKKS